MQRIREPRKTKSDQVHIVIYYVYNDNIIIIINRKTNLGNRKKFMFCVFVEFKNDINKMHMNCIT